MHLPDIFPPSPDRKKQILYFDDAAQRYMPQMRLLFRGGQLKKKEGWRNVAEHCVMQLAAAEMLAELLHLSEEEKKKLCSVAAVHDWRKRIDVGNRKMNKLECEEREAPRSALTLLEEHAQQFVQSVNPDPDLMSATGPNFLVRALVDKKATFPEKLQFYLDDICGDREIIPGTKVPDIMPLRERIAEVASRRPEFNDDADLTAALGGKF